MFDQFADILSKCGYQYDSSIIADRFYDKNTKPEKYKPHKIGKIIECPVSSGKFFGYNIPVSGGYFRFLPKSLIRNMISAYEKKGDVVLYFHPKDIDPQNPTLPLPWRYNFLHRFGTKHSKIKLIELLNDYKFCSFEEYFNQYSRFDLNDHNARKELQSV